MTRIRVENLEGLDRLKKRFVQLVNPDATDLMLSWQEIIRDDNRRGVLAGEDKDGVSMVPVTYRPKPPPDYYRKILGYDPSKVSSRMRHGQKSGRMRNLLFKGLGPHAAGLHNNLESSEYRYLTGPPLAPRRQFSRVISNLRTGFKPWIPTIAGALQWEAFGYWDEVVGRDGTTKFLMHHFDGDPLGPHGPRIRRDLRGVRPPGRRRALSSLRAWFIDLMKRI